MNAISLILFTLIMSDKYNFLWGIKISEELQSKISYDMVREATEISVKNSEGNYAKYEFLRGIWWTPVAPGLFVFAFDRSYGDGLICLESQPEYTSYRYVVFEESKKIKKILTVDLFKELIDTSDVIRLKNEKETFQYVRFLLEAIYHKKMLIYYWSDYNDGKKALLNKSIRLYLKENIPDSSENYFTRIKETPEGYLVTTYAYKDKYKFHNYDYLDSFNPLDFFVSKWTFLLKRNGVLLDVKVDSLPLPVHKELLVIEGKDLKPFVELKFSDSLAVRQCLKCPTPGFPGWAKKKKISATIKFYVEVGNDGYILGGPIVLITTGYEKWDKSVIKCLKKWRWQKCWGLGDLARWKDTTNGTITVSFGWKE